MAGTGISLGDKFRALAALLAYPTLSCKARLVGSHLISCFNIESGRCNPRISTMMKVLRLSERCVYRALAELVKGGVVEREQWLGNSSRINYRPRFDLLAPRMETRSPKTGNPATAGTQVDNTLRPQTGNPATGGTQVDETLTPQAGNSATGGRVEQSKEQGSVSEHLRSSETEPGRSQARARKPASSSHAAPDDGLQGNGAEPNSQALQVARGSIRLALKGYLGPEVREALAQLDDTAKAALVHEIAVMPIDARPKWDFYSFSSHIRKRIIEMATERTDATS